MNITDQYDYQSLHFLLLSSNNYISAMEFLVAEREKD